MSCAPEKPARMYQPTLLLGTSWLWCRQSGRGVCVCVQKNESPHQRISFFFYHLSVTILRCRIAIVFGRSGGERIYNFVQHAWNAQYVKYVMLGMYRVRSESTDHSLDSVFCLYNMYRM